jgi:peptidoglycan/LPS O-acetylase OafA/YrhL
MSTPATLSTDGYEPLFMLSHRQNTFGALAVDIFFALSGMLITASWFRAKGMSDFLRRRILRIYPAFIAAILFTGTLAFLADTHFRHIVGRRDYAFAMVSDWIFLSTTTTHWVGMLQSSPCPGFWNGSLWTIVVEFQCYLLVAAVGLFALFKRRYLILLATLAYFVFVSYQAFHGIDEMEPTYLCFLIGMCFYLFRDKIKLSFSVAILSFAILVALVPFRPWLQIVFPVLGSYVVFWIGFSSYWRISRLTNRTDLSYGTYLYACAIQQFFALNPHWRTPLINTLVAAPITLGLAWLSWHFVESPALRMKGHHLIDFDPAKKS